MHRGLLLCLVMVAAWAAAAATQSSDLPEGEGRKILERACTTCHDLGEVTKFRDYYTRDDWRDIVATMVKYGAELKDGESDVLVDYLAKNFGKRTTDPAK